MGELLRFPVRPAVPGGPQATATTTSPTFGPTPGPTPARPQSTRVTVTPGQHRRARPVEPLWREAVGSELRRLRGERGQRLADVADRAGISTQYLSEIERGLKDPSSEILSAVAGALDLTVRQLVVRSAGALAAGAPQGPVCLAS